MVATRFFENENNRSVEPYCENIWATSERNYGDPMNGVGFVSFVSFVGSILGENSDTNIKSRFLAMVVSSVAFTQNYPICVKFETYLSWRSCAP